MRVHKVQYKDKNGRKKYLKNWWIELKDHNQIVRRFSGFPDKQQSMLLGKQIERLVNYKNAGEQPDGQLTKFIEGMSPKLRSKLADLELLDSKTIAAGTPLSKHVDDFFQSLLAKGDTEKQANTVISRVKRVLDGCKFEKWNDIVASKIEQYLSKMRNSGEGISAQTSNFYLKAVKQFCRWMVLDQRANPLQLDHLKGLNVKTDRRHDRQALQPDQIRKLLEVTKDAPTRFGMTGFERAMLYRLAVETGLRRNELKSLTVSSFDFDHCTVTVEAAYSKHRRQDILPLRVETAEELQKFLTGKIAAVKVFLNIPDKTSKMLKADLDEAGIPYIDDAGRYADFHSLRHSTGSLLAAAGVHPKVIQSIMRHSDINLTMSRYTHIFRGQESEAIGKLPDLSQSSKAQKLG